MTGRDFEHPRCSHEKRPARLGAELGSRQHSVVGDACIHQMLLFNNIFFKIVFWIYKTRRLHASLSHRTCPSTSRPDIVSRASPTSPGFHPHRYDTAHRSAQHATKTQPRTVRPVFPRHLEKESGCPGIAAPFPLLILHPEQTRPGQRAVPLPGIRPTKNEMELLHAGIL